MTEDDAAERSCNIAQRVDTQCRKRADRSIGGREEKRSENERGGAGIDEEIVPLDDGADGAGRYDLARGRSLTRRAGVRLASARNERDYAFRWSLSPPSIVR